MNVSFCHECLETDLHLFKLPLDIKGWFPTCSVNTLGKFKYSIFKGKNKHKDKKAVKLSSYAK